MTEVRLVHDHETGDIKIETSDGKELSIYDRVMETIMCILKTHDGHMHITDENKKPVRKQSIKDFGFQYVVFNNKFNLFIRKNKVFGIEIKNISFNTSNGIKSKMSSEKIIDILGEPTWNKKKIILYETVLEKYRIVFQLKENKLYRYITI